MRLMFSLSLIKAFCVSAKLKSFTGCFIWLFAAFFYMILFFASCADKRASSSVAPQEDTTENIDSATVGTDVKDSFVAGYSVQNRPVEVTRIGKGKERALVIMGSIHGEEKNTFETVKLILEEYESGPGNIPEDVTLFFVPLVNPDGSALEKRENANGVDLNHNFPARDWSKKALNMRSVMVDGLGGESPGSEPEVKAVIRLLMETIKPHYEYVCVVMVHSASPPAGYVQPAYLENGVPEPLSLALAGTASRASGYNLLASWKEANPVTGELIRFCAENEIRGMDLELPTYDSPDVIPKGKSESTFASCRKLIDALIKATKW